MYKLTIFIPVYNCEDLVIRALDSIPKRKDVEYIIIEDCSTDNSYEVCKKWVEDNKDLNCILIKNEENKGIGYNKKVAYEMASGEYIITVDSDDWCNTKDYNAAIDCLYKLDTYDRIIFPVAYNDGHISNGEVRTAT